MTRYLLLVISLGFFAITSLQSQDRWCGMNEQELELVTKKLITNQKLLANFSNERSGMPTYIPLKFHILSNSAGFGGISEIEIFEQVCKLNEHYLDQDIVFFVEGDFNYISNTAAYEEPRSGGGQLQLANAKNQNFGRVNIFLPLNAGDIANVGTSAGFYDPNSDWIVVRKNEVSNSTETLTHEIGHFFSLQHTFRGWDFSPYDPAIHPNPAPEFSPSPYAPQRVENMDRTGSCKNCEIAGDRLCDTNPDYLLSQNFSTGNCGYTGQIMDPCGVLVEPTRENYMSYFFGCDYSFTQEQKDLIQVDISRRLNQAGTINRIFQPDNMEPVTEPVVAVNPAMDETLGFNNIVHLEWDPVPNATKYIVDIDQFSSFTISNQRFFSSYAGAQVEDLAPNDTYYWRVYAYNEASTCLGWSETFVFNTGEGVTSTVGIPSVNTWQIEPNPLTAGNSVNIRISAQEQLNAAINITDITGRQIITRSENLNSGSNRITLPTEGLQNGIYIVSIETKSGVLSKKLIIN